MGRTLIQTAPASIVHLHATQRNTPVVGATAHTIELSEADAVAALFERLQPTLVIHTAFSMHAGERDIWQATRQVVAGCQATQAELIYLSTDALFDGEHPPYREEDDPAPVHEYGRWKAKAEWFVREEMPAAAVIRTSLITQLTPLDPRCRWIVNSLREKKPISLFVDELRCPILVEDIATQIWELAALPASERAGIWHLAGVEALSRYAIGLLVAAHKGLDPAGITPAYSASFPTPRPRDLRMLTTRADKQLKTKARPLSVLLHK